MDLNVVVATLATAAGAGVAGLGARMVSRTLAISFERERAATADRLSAGIHQRGSDLVVGSRPEPTSAATVDIVHTGELSSEPPAADVPDGPPETATRDGFATVLIEYYSYALTQARRSFFTSQIFSALGVLVILGGIGLAIWRAETSGEMFAAIVSSSSGLICAVIGQLIHRRADIALKHMSDQTESLRSDMRLERSLEQAIGLLNDVADPKVKSRLVAGLVMKLSGADMPSVQDEGTVVNPGAASANGSASRVQV